MRTLLKLALPLMGALLVVGGTAEADDTIQDIQLELYPVGTEVTIEDVVVTAVGRFGFFVQEPDEDVVWGRQYSGIWVYTNLIPTVRRGDLVNVTGSYEEYYDFSEIDLWDEVNEVPDGTYTLIGSATVPDPVDVTIPEVNDTGIFAEAYESVFIRVDREDDTLHSYPPDNYNEWYLKRGAGEDSLLMESYSALPTGDFEYDVPDSGTVLSYAQGIHTYSYGSYKLAPRNCDEDLGMACVPRLRGAYAMSATEVGVQFGVEVTEESAENVDNYELISGLNVLSASQHPDNAKRVTLTTDDLGNGEEEELVVSNIESTEGATMSGSESAAFRTGITPIEDIQYVSTPSSSDISPMNTEIVTVKGYVTALDGANYYYLQDGDGGPWDGLYCRVARSSPYVGVGSLVTVAGRVREYYGMTQLSYSSGTDYFVDHETGGAININLITCSDLPYRDDMNTSEQWEDCLVRMEGASLDSIDGVVGPYYQEWLLFQAGDPDTSQMDFYELNGPHGYHACIGDEINLTGIVANAYSEYTIYPRYGRGIDIEVIYDNPDCAPTGVEDADLLGRGPRLRNEPNPFNPRTTIRFQLSSADQVLLEIIDPAGRLVRTLVAGEAMDAGGQEVVWDGRDNNGHLAGSGTYFARLKTTKGFTANKMIMLK